MLDEREAGELMKNTILCMTAIVTLTSMAFAGETGDLIRKRYATQPSLVDVSCEPPSTPTNYALSGEDQLKDFFEKEGVRLSQGSIIAYEPATSTLLVVATEENHRKINDVLHQLNVAPNQIDIHALVVSFEIDDIDEALRADSDTNLAGDEVLRLYRNGQGELLHTLKVITRSGVNADAQSVSERIYPTEFEVVGPTSQVANASTSPGFAVNPGDFETREVGAILNVTPTLGPNASLVDLTLIFELSEELEETVFKTKYGDHVLEVSQPKFHSKSTTTSILVQNGETISLGGWNDVDNETVTYILITVTLLDAAGKPMTSSLVY